MDILNEMMAYETREPIKSFFIVIGVIWFFLRSYQSLSCLVQATLKMPWGAERDLKDPDKIIGTLKTKPFVVLVHLLFIISAGYLLLRLLLGHLWIAGDLSGYFWDRAMVVVFVMLCLFGDRLLCFLRRFSGE